MNRANLQTSVSKMWSEIELAVFSSGRCIRGTGEESEHGMCQMHSVATRNEGIRTQMELMGQLGRPRRTHLLTK